MDCRPTDRRKVNEQVPLVCAPPTLSTCSRPLHELPEPLPFSMPATGGYYRGKVVPDVLPKSTGEDKLFVGTLALRPLAPLGSRRLD